MPADFARSVISLFATSSGKGRLLSSAPRSYSSSGRCPFAKSRQSSGTAPPAESTRLRIEVVQFPVNALYHSGWSAIWLISFT